MQKKWAKRTRKRKVKYLIPGAIFLLAIFAAHALDFEETIQNCPDFQYEQYRVIPYIKAAIQLQNMGEQSAISLLKYYSEMEENQNRVIILCRMLFDTDVTGEFRRSLIGGAVFAGNSSYADWPREPIEIVQDIPFLIARGYTLGGMPERAIDYLEYCDQNCVWKEDNYRIPSESDLLVSVEELLNSDKWQIPLTAEEVEFIRSQIEN